MNCCYFIYYQLVGKKSVNGRKPFMLYGKASDVCIKVVKKVDELRNTCIRIVVKELIDKDQRKIYDWQKKED